jgi:hypothetical protein
MDLVGVLTLRLPAVEWDDGADAVAAAAVPSADDDVDDESGD